MRRGIGNSKPKLRKQSLKWLRSIKYKGLSYIEYKLDSRDGCYKLIELNARSWLNQFMATQSGINFPFVIYQANIGKPITKKKKQVDGVEWVSWVEEILYMLGDLTRINLKIKQWLKNTPHGKDIIFGWKDPLPAFVVPLYLIESYLSNRVKFKKLFRKVQ